MCPSEIQRDIGRKSSIFTYPLAFNAPVGRVPVGLAPLRLVWKTRMVWLPDGGKISKIGLCLFVLTDRRTQTDRRTGRHVRMPAYTASDKQFPEVFVTIVALNQAVLFTTLQHLYVLPVVMFQTYLSVNSGYISARNVSYAYSVFWKIRTYIYIYYTGALFYSPMHQTCIRVFKSDASVKSTGE